MNGINLKQLEAFVAVVECSNFTEAASRLFLAQSTVSCHIKALEESLGIELFKRESKKRVSLTTKGRQVYLYAREIVDKCNALEADIIGDAERELVIGASTVPSEGILPGLIAGFSKKHPECCITVKSGDTKHIHELLQDGEIQLGFVGTADNRQSLVYQRVAEDRLMMITPNTPRFEKLKAAGAFGRELLGEPIVFREQGSGTQSTIDNYLSGRDIDSKRMKVVAYVANPDAMKKLVAMGAGVAIMSELSAEEEVASGRVLRFELDKAPVSRNIYMVHRKKGNMTKLGEEFAAFVRQEMNINDKKA